MYYLKLWPKTNDWVEYVDKKLISRSKKEMENFIWTKFEDYNPERASQLWELFHPLEVNTQLYKFFETEGCTLSDLLLTVYTIQI